MPASASRSACPTRPEGHARSPVSILFPAGNTPVAFPPPKETKMSAQRSGNSAGIGIGGILVIIGIVLAIIWSVWIGVIVALVGLIAFGGFARGKWY